MFDDSLLLNAVPVKVFIDNLGLYDNFYRNVHKLKSGFKFTKIRGHNYIILPEWFLVLCNNGFKAYSLSNAMDYKFDFTFELTTRTRVGIYKL